MTVTVLLPGLVEHMGGPQAPGPFGLFFAVEEIEKTAARRFRARKPIYFRHGFVAVQNCQLFGIQNENRVRNIVENRVVALLGFHQQLFELFRFGNVQAEFHGGHHIAVVIADRRRGHNPVAEGAVLVGAGFFAQVGSAV